MRKPEFEDFMMFLKALFKTFLALVALTVVSFILAFLNIMVGTETMVLGAIVIGMIMYFFYLEWTDKDDKNL